MKLEEFPEYQLLTELEVRHLYTVLKLQEERNDDNRNGTIVEFERRDDVASQYLEYKALEDRLESNKLLLSDRSRNVLQRSERQAFCMNWNLNRNPTKDLVKCQECDYCGLTFEVPKYYLLHLLWECLDIPDQNDGDVRQKVISYVYHSYKIIQMTEKERCIHNKKLKKLMKIRANQVSILIPKMQEFECPLCERRVRVLEDYSWNHLFTHLIKESTSTNAICIMIIMECLMHKYGQQLLDDDWSVVHVCKYGCGSKFYSDHDVKRHYLEEAKRRTENEVFMCITCNFAAETKKHLITHLMRQHSGKCQKCERFTFQYERGTLDHVENCRPPDVRINSNDSDVYCKFCDFKVESHQQNGQYIMKLMGHVVQKHFGLCPTCENFTFEYDQNALNHIETCKGKEAPIKSDCWFVPCKLCDHPRPTILITEYDQHILEHENGDVHTRGTRAACEFDSNGIKYLKKFTSAK